MGRLRHIGFGVSAALLIATAALGCAGFAAAAADASVYASALQKIFGDLDAHGVTMAFGGPIAVPLGVAKPGQTVQVEELPPVRMNSDLVYVFERFRDGSGCIILQFTTSGFVALRFDKDFEFVAGATQRPGQPVAVLSGAAAEEVVAKEMQDCETIASRLTTSR